MTNWTDSESLQKLERHARGWELRCPCAISVFGETVPNQGTLLRRFWERDCHRNRAMRL
jgi:hypothetical protein